MDTARTFKRIISVDCINSTITNTSNTRYYLPTRNDIQLYTIKAIAANDVIDSQADYYLTLIDNNNETLLSQYPLADLSLSFQFLQMNDTEKLRLFNLKGINTRKSYLEIIQSGGSTFPFASGATLAKIQFYI